MRYGRLLATAVLALIAARPTLGSEIAKPREIAKSANRLETTLSRPKAYGTESYTITVVPAIAFFPEAEGQAYSTSGSLGRFGPPNTVQNFYAPIELPAGAIVDYIGLNSTTDAPFALGAAVYHRFPDGTAATIGEISSTVHDWATDYNAAPINTALGSSTASHIVRVQQGSHPNLQFFGHVEVWWKRSVRQTLAVTFNDVPFEHPFHRFVEALAASGITAGCGGGNFCPENPVTRGQMAAFLAKALGLHWGSPGPP